MRTVAGDRVQWFTITAIVAFLGVLSGSCGDSDDEAEKTLAKVTASDRREIIKKEAGPVVPEKVTKYIKALTNENSRVREHAAKQLGGMGPEAKGAVKALARVLGDRSEFVRKAATIALGEIRPTDMATVTSIVVSFGDESEGVRKAAAETLVKIGPSIVRPLARWIEQLLEKGEFDVVTKIGLNDGDWRKLAKAADVLKQIGPGAEPAVVTLMKLEGTACSDARLVPGCYAAHEAAASALRKIGPAKTQTLIATLKDVDPDMRRLAALALAKVGPEAIRALPYLTRMFREDDKPTRASAAKALAGMGPAAIPVLLEALHEKKASIRELAVKTLIKMGPAAKEAKPELEKLVENEKRWTRRAAKDVLAKI
ncbi:MAG: HEAT repeat domain-containing protein [Deltaproteobacteria bacterium]|nr:HEAT repeat domain-containing protein [Deltaproteobacteria bacterium]